MRYWRSSTVQHGAVILVHAVGLEGDVHPVDQRCHGLLRSLVVGLAFLGAVDAVEADSLRVLVTEDFDPVAG